MPLASFVFEPTLTGFRAVDLEKIVDIAPIFDNNPSLFPRDFDESLEWDMMRRRIEEAPGILDATLAQQGRLLMESAQKQHLQRLIDFEFDDDGFIGCYRQSHPEGKTVSRNRLERLGSFVRRRARELLETH